MDQDGFLRVKGRLQMGDLSFESKHPLILPSCHMVLLLVRFQHIHLKHAGVATLLSSLRGRYWIVGACPIAKRVCKECVFCKRQDSKACTQPFAPLPSLRIKEAPVFSVCGMDFAGPLFCVDYPGCKFYILLITCAVVRAVHLELVTSLSQFDCLLAFHRFVS